MYQTASLLISYFKINMTNEQIKVFRRIFLFSHICGMPYMWFEDLEWPYFIKKAHGKITKLINVSNYLILILGVFALHTQKHLNDQQMATELALTFAHPLCYASSLSLAYYKEDVRRLVRNLVVVLPSIYNDPGVEGLLVNKAKLCAIACIGFGNCAVLFGGFDGIFQVFVKGGVFAPIILAWPDVCDTSSTAAVARVVIYIFWWFLISRLSVSIVLAVSLTLCVSHQFKQLQNYFCSLSECFDDNALNQEHKELKYEAGLKKAFKMHTDILRCMHEMVKICSVTYGGYILVNIGVLAIVMAPLASNDTSFSGALFCCQMGISVLIINGFFMSILGDITIEADKLLSAMYKSGWENCQGTSSVRIRRLLAIAMAQTQNPLTIRALGFITVSYEAYVSILKASYSVFSVLR